MSNNNEVTSLLTACERGEPKAAEALLPLVYDELRRLAAIRISKERPGISLQATGLVHEAYIRLVGSDRNQYWDCRAHFFAAAAEAMRRILVDRARQARTIKRGGEHRRIELNLDATAEVKASDELISLSDALDALKVHDPQLHQLVMLRHFGGLTHQEASEVLGVGRRAADRMWAVARVWLHEQLRELNDR